MKPATHEQLYCPTGIDESDVDSVHVAPFTHGLLEHSFTTTSQVPPWAMLHCFVYCLMKLYAHVPRLKPATQAHENTDGLGGAGEGGGDGERGEGGSTGR